ncbi:MAG: hypothetical protein AAF826_10570 [Pseudomonadota bacterium]
MGGETAQSLRLTALDYRLLRLIRCLLMQPTEPDHPQWRRAHQIAQETFLIIDAALIVESMWRIIQHIEQVRQSAFLFVRPDDAHAHIFLTPEERLLIEFLHFLRIENLTAARTLLMMLCEGGDGQALMSEARKLCDVLSTQVDNAQQKAS